MLRSKFFMSGIIIVLMLVLSILFLPMIIPFEPRAMDISARLLPPDGLSKGLEGHILGTDALGRDMLVRLLVGGRLSFMIAVISVVGSGLIGTIFGVLSGYMGRKVDTLIMRISDIQLAINVTLLAIVVVAVMGNSVVNLILVMIITSWVRFTRIVRSEVLFIKTKEFVQASVVLGGSKLHIMFNQILPNVTTSLIVMLSQTFGFVILVEASLSFLSMGIPITEPSWGGMIAEGRDYLATAPWVVVVPGLALMFTVLAFNFLGDGIRDILDPKMKH